MTELIGLVKNGKLKPYSEWMKWVESLKNLSINASNKDLLRDSIVNSIIKRLPKEHFGLFFSGGVDSTTIAFILKQQKVSFTCYTVGFRDDNITTPLDILFARRVAKLLDLDYKEKIFNIKEAEEIIKRTVSILPKPAEVNADYVVKVGVGAVIIGGASISEDKIFFGGLGSEEIFAGYDRHAKSSNINQECWNGLKKMWKRDFTRDYAIAKALNLTLLTPYLDENVIVQAMQVPGDQKIKAKYKKVILREISEELGLPKEFAWRKKQGAQYGSKFDKAIEKLAKKHNCKTKGEYLQTLL